MMKLSEADVIAIAEAVAKALDEREQRGGVAKAPRRRRGPMPMRTVPTGERELDAWADDLLRHAPGVRVTRSR